MCLCAALHRRRSCLCARSGQGVLNCIGFLVYGARLLKTDSRGSMRPLVEWAYQRLMQTRSSTINHIHRKVQCTASDLTRATVLRTAPNPHTLLFLHVQHRSSTVQLRSEYGTLSKQDKLCQRPLLARKCCCAMHIIIVWSDAGTFRTPVGILLTDLWLCNTAGCRQPQLCCNDIIQSATRLPFWIGPPQRSQDGSPGFLCPSRVRSFA